MSYKGQVSSGLLYVECEDCDTYLYNHTICLKCIRFNKDAKEDLYCKDKQE